jgi:hypothetical protein
MLIAGICTCGQISNAHKLMLLGKDSATEIFILREGYTQYGYLSISELKYIEGIRAEVKASGESMNVYIATLAFLLLLYVLIILTIISNLEIENNAIKTFDEVIRELDKGIDRIIL